MSESMQILPQAQRAAKSANLKFEEFAYDFKKQLGKWDRQYRVTEKAQKAKEYAIDQAQNVDRQFGIRQKARNASADFRLRLPTVCGHHLYASQCLELFRSSLQIFCSSSSGQIDAEKTKCCFC